MSAERMSGDGNAIVLAAGVGGLGIGAACLALFGTDQAGTTIALRATALFSFPFLASAYAASPLAILWPGAIGEWLLHSRRALGLAFSAAFGAHLAMIVYLFSLPPDPPLKVLGLVPGIFTYTVVAAMVAVSLSYVSKTIGSSRVRILLRLGLHYVFLYFTLALFKGVFIRHHYAWWVGPLMIALGVYAIRLIAWRRPTRPEEALA